MTKDDAWNAHDLDLIMTHYENAIELTSPAAAQLLATPSGKVVGNANLKAYFQRGLEAYPELQFHLENVFLGISSVVLVYTNKKGTRTAEFMELSATGNSSKRNPLFESPSLEQPEKHMAVWKFLHTNQTSPTGKLGHQRTRIDNARR